MQGAITFNDLLKELKDNLSPAGKEFMPLMENLLKTNPYFRPSVHECLKSAAFDPYRNHKKEGIINEMRGFRKKLVEQESMYRMMGDSMRPNNPYQIQLDIDKEDVVDYKENKM